MSSRRGRVFMNLLPSRRDALGLGLGGMALGCGLGPAPQTCGDTAAGTGLDPEGESPTVRELLSSIDTLVVVMLENRSFDHHLGALRSDADYPGRARIDGLRGDESNPDEAGRPVSVRRLPHESRYNPGHRWEPAHASWNRGRLDRFVLSNPGPDQANVMGFHARERLPLLYALADRYTVCDRWFASVMGPTWPNRFHLHAATSMGMRNNASAGFAAPPTVWDRMASRCLPAKNYSAGPIPWYHAAFPAKSFSGNDALTPAPMEEFFRDALAGELPHLAIIDPDYLANDGHPKHDLALAEAFVGSIFRAMAESPQWSRSLLVVTHDEHGGFFDHVPPPTTVDPRPDFRQLGFRVPTVVIGPHVWQGGVVSTQFEHVSVAATLRARFGIATLGPRMDATSDLSSCIDPQRLGDPAPAPRELPVVTLGERREVRAAVGPTTQGEYQALLDERRLPEGLVDPRSAEERLRGWLRWGQELGAVRVLR